MKVAPNVVVDNQLLGKDARPARTDTSGPSADPVVESAYQAGAATQQWMRRVLGRENVMGNDKPLVIKVHTPPMRTYREGRPERWEKTTNGAYWTGNHATIDDGDQVIYRDLALAPDVVAHEIGHGILESEVPDLTDTVEGCAIHEAWSDLVACAVTGDWRIGESIALQAPEMRNLANPQFSTVSQCQTYFAANPKAHVDSHALAGPLENSAYLAARRLGADEVARIWYHAIEHNTTAGTTYLEFAHSLLDAARSMHGPTSAESWALESALRSNGLLRRSTEEHAPLLPE